MTTTPPKQLELPTDLNPAVNPYTGESWDASSVITSSGYVPPAGPPTEADAKAALLELANRQGLGYAGRWCSVCHSDLSDVGAPMPCSQKGFEASTGQRYDGTAWPQGGHAADCPIPVLLEWIDGKPSPPYTRRRPDVATPSSEHPAGAGS